MNIELFVILALIFVFLVSCGGLIQKIKQNYEEERVRVLVPLQGRIPRRTEQVRDSYEESSGVFPAGISPPPYTVYLEPPPKYEEVVKDTVIVIPPASIHTVPHRTENTQGSHTSNENPRV